MLFRSLDGGDTPLRVQIGSNNIRAHVGDFIFTSKLVIALIEVETSLHRHDVLAAQLAEDQFAGMAFYG